MCWEETEETIIHDEYLSGELQKGRQHFLLMGLTLYGEILNTRHLLGEIYKEIYITRAGEHDKQKIHGKKCNMNI